MPFTLLDNPTQKVIFGDEPMMLDNAKEVDDAYDTLLWCMKKPSPSDDPMLVLTKYGFSNKKVSARFISGLVPFLNKVKDDFFTAVSIGKEGDKTIVEVMAVRSNKPHITHETVFKEAFKTVLGFGPEPADCDDPQPMD